MASDIKSFYFKNSFYIGHPVFQNYDWVSLVTISNDSVYTNLHLFRLSFFKNDPKFKEIEFYNFQKQNHNLLDPFDLKQKANKLAALKGNSDELFSYIKNTNPIISLTSQNKNLQN